MEMDPVLIRATRLLHSKSKDSTEQLRAILEDVIKQRYGENRSLSQLTMIKEYMKEANPKYASSGGRREDKEMEKKRHEKVSMIDATDPIIAKPVEILKSKPIQLQVSPRAKEPEIRKELNVHDDDEDDDDDDLALEILEDDLSCVVCRGMSVGVCNQLVECLECHSLYHQECHQPPVTKADINDPRWAWYCASCTKAINKQPSKTTTSAKPSSSSHSSSHASAKPSQKQPDLSQTLFKRTDSKSLSGSKTTPIQASTMGMAGLAATYQPTASTTSSSSSSKSLSSSSSAGKVIPPKVVTNVISADKRLANMKKKAAKQQEKRKHIK